MKKRKTGFIFFVLLICGLSFIVLCGCETVKGMGRDIKGADQWMKDHLW